MELLRALALFCEPPTARQSELATMFGFDPPTETDFADAFVFQCFPYASVYTGAEGMLGGEALDRVAGFLRALGGDPPREPDHLAVLLSAYAELVELEECETDPDRCRARRRARKALFWEHLASWLPGFLHKIRNVAPAYRAWADLLLDVVRSEAQLLGPPDRIPLHMRTVTGVPDPRGGESKEFLAALLAPVRTGMILVRDDLARAARTLDLGLRMGERRFVLTSLLSQDAGAVLGWLADEASAWSSLWRGMEPWFSTVATTWASRAEATEDLLRQLAATDALHPAGSVR